MTALARLRSGEPVFGLFQTYPLVPITELVRWCRYDFVILDCEHGVVDESAQLAALQCLADTEAFALVRLRGRDRSEVARYLDFGADGVIVPDVRTVEQAREIAFAATQRWTGGVRGDRYGLDHAKTAPFVMLLIESEEGVGNIEAMLDIGGIDGIMIGPGDLSTDMGAPGDFASPRYREAVARVERAALARNKVLGGKAYPGFPLDALYERGHRLFIVGRDMPVMRETLEAHLAAAKAATKGLS